ncbi:MAG: hypothetical protein INR73_05505 [Williamsia sp.]|nr:hypothetical protein [Williamsia sp.]
MKKTFIILLLAVAGVLCSTNIMAQSAQPQPKYVQITTIESVVNGGLGRSKMIVTKEDGSQDEKDLNNLFSMVGINFKNIRENESSIIGTLKSYTDNGWKLVSTVPLTLSPGNNGTGIFMTRYLLCK